MIECNSLEKIFARTKTNKAGCWEWQGGVFTSPNKMEYPQITYKDKGYRGNRLVWILKFGSIPKGMLVLHKCDNSICINPEHLEIGTHKKNIQDAVTRKRHYNIKKTECAHGHKYNSENSITETIKSGVKRRRCLICGWYYGRKLKPKKEIPYCITNNCTHRYLKGCERFKKGQPK